MTTVLARLRLDVPPAAHDYVLGDGLLSSLGTLCTAVGPAGACALVTDRAVAATDLVERATASLRDAGFLPEVIVVPTGEASKTVAEAERIWNRLAEARIERGGVVFALGGGAVGDVAGFCASTWQRGVALVQVPTTLLAMADSSVGGKTAVNLAAGKNLVGTFHPPALVVADLACLDSLPDRELRSGFAEIVKCAVLADRDRLAELRDRAPALLARDRAALVAAITMAVEVKADHVRDDVHDVAGRRALLNLGHTVAHALEAETGFGSMLHGEAVSVGLVAAARVAASRGICGAELADELVATLQAFGLPVAPHPGPDPARLLDRARQDKKRARGHHRMALPLAAGGAALVEVTDDDLLAALRPSA